MQAAGKQLNHDEVDIMSSMSMRPRYPISGYEFPVAVSVDACMAFPAPVEMSMRGYRAQQITRSVDECAGPWVRDVAALVGQSIDDWRIFQTDYIPEPIARAMSQRVSFRWPMFPHDAASLGFGNLPEEPMPVFKPVGAESTEVNSDADGEDEPNVSQDRCDGESDPALIYEARYILPFLRFKALLRPGANVKLALSLVASILGVSPSTAEQVEPLVVAGRCVSGRLK